MKKITVQTKNGGKVSVPVYETLEELQKVMKAEDVLKNLNRIIRVDLINEANRTQSVTAKLKKAMKDGKITEEQIKALLSQA